MADPHRSQLVAHRPRIKAAERRLKDAISLEFYQELCDATRCNNATEMQISAIALCLNVIGSEIDNCHREALLHCKLLVKFLDENIKYFSTYANSSAYEANNFKQYQNAVNDSCYFFG